jgi:hypothetical protein
MSQKNGAGAWTSWVQVVVVVLGLLLASLMPEVRPSFGLLWGLVWGLVALVHLVEFHGGHRELDFLEGAFGILMLAIPYVSPYLGTPGLRGRQFWFVEIGLGAEYYVPTYLVAFGLILIIEGAQLLLASQNSSPSPGIEFDEDYDDEDGEGEGEDEEDGE